MMNESKKLEPRVDTRDDEVEQEHQEQIALRLAAFQCQPDRQRLSNRYGDTGDAVNIRLPNKRVEGSRAL